MQSQSQPSQTADYIIQGIMAILLFFICRDWLQPLLELSPVTEIYQMDPFLIAIAGYIFINLVRCPLYISPFLFVWISFMVIAHFFHETQIIDPSWWYGMVQIWIGDASQLATGNWYALSGESRTLIFLIGWAFLITAVVKLMLEKYMIGWFIMLTIGYLMFILYAGGLQAGTEIVSTFGWGMLLIGLNRWRSLHVQYAADAHPRKSMTREGTDQSVAKYRYGAWLFACIILIGGSVAGSFYLTQPMLDEPVESIFQHTLPSFSTQQKTGYSAGISRLGGSLQPDHQVRFTAKTEQLVYWRGETKSVYDGRRWLDHAGTHTRWGAAALAEPQLHKDWGEPIQQELHFLSDARGTLFAGGRIEQMQGTLSSPSTAQDSSDTSFSLSDVWIETRSLRYALGQDRGAESYQLQVQIPSVRKIENSRDYNGELHQLKVSDLDEMKDQLQPYLQLPSSLPQRVVELAEQLAAESDGIYEISQHIEDYLRLNYTYNMEDVESLQREEDFVDQFLFEQQLGYCDHFSSSMVVLLRALGIPARYVKGYASGDITQHPSASDPYYQVTVRNSHAHSWVEVYFPRVGWLPFEPTPGFSASDQAVAAAATPDGFSKTDSNSPLFNMMNQWSVNQLMLVGFLVMLLFLMGVEGFKYSRSLYVILNRGKTWIWIRISKTPQDARVPMEQLWQQLYKVYGVREDTLTLREYVKTRELNHEEARVSLEQFLQVYESLSFGGDKLPRKWNLRLLNSWKSAIKAGSCIKDS